MKPTYKTQFPGGALAAISAAPLWNVPPMRLETFWLPLTRGQNAPSYFLVGSAFSATSCELQAYAVMREVECILAGEEDANEEASGLLIARLADMIDHLSTGMMAWNDLRFYLQQCQDNSEETDTFSLPLLIAEVDEQIDRLWKICSLVQEPCLALCDVLGTPVPRVVADCSKPDPIHIASAISMVSQRLDHLLIPGQRRTGTNRIRDLIGRGCRTIHQLITSIARSYRPSLATRITTEDAPESLLHLNNDAAERTVLSLPTSSARTPQGGLS